MRYFIPILTLLYFSLSFSYSQTRTIKGSYLYNDAIDLAEKLRALQASNDSLGTEYLDRIQTLQEEQADNAEKMASVQKRLNLQQEAVEIELQKENTLLKLFDRVKSLSQAEQVSLIDSFINSGILTKEDLLVSSSPSQIPFFQAQISLLKQEIQSLKEDSINISNERVEAENDLSIQVKVERNAYLVELYEKKYRYSQGSNIESIHLSPKDFQANPFLRRELSQQVFTGLERDSLLSKVAKRIDRIDESQDIEVQIDKRAEQDFETGPLESSRVSILNAQQRQETRASTNIIDGLSRFIIKRAKQELGVAFLQKFSESLEDAENYPELQTLFPETRSFLGRFDVENNRPLLEIAKHSFETDMVKLPSHIPSLLANEDINRQSRDSKGAFALAILYEIIDKSQREIPINATISLVRNKVLRKHERTQVESYQRLKEEKQLAYVINFAKKVLEARQERLDRALDQLYTKVIAQENLEDCLNSQMGDDASPLASEEVFEAGPGPRGTPSSPFPRIDERANETVPTSNRDTYDEIYLLETYADYYRDLLKWLNPLPASLNENVFSHYAEDYSLFYNGTFPYTQEFSSLSDSLKAAIRTDIQSIQYKVLEVAAEELEDRYNFAMRNLAEVNQEIDNQTDSLRLIEGFEACAFSGELYENLVILTQQVKMGFEDISPSFEEPASDLFEHKEVLQPLVEGLKEKLDAVHGQIEDSAWTGGEETLFPMLEALDQELENINSQIGQLSISLSLGNRYQLFISAGALRETISNIFQLVPNPYLALPEGSDPVIKDTLAFVQSIYCRNFRKDTEDKKGSYEVLKFTESLYKSLDFVAPILNSFRTNLPDTTKEDQANYFQRERWLTKGEFQELFSDPAKRNAFLGLLYYQVSSLDTTQKREALDFYPAQFFGLVNQLNQQRKGLQALRDQDSIISLNTYVEVIRNSLEIVNLGAQVKGPSGDILFPGLNVATKIGEESLNLFDNVYNKNYGYAVYNMIQLVDLLSTGDESSLGLNEGEQYELEQRLLRLSPKERANYHGLVTQLDKELSTISDQFKSKVDAGQNDQELERFRVENLSRLNLLRDQIQGNENLRASLWDEYLYVDRLTMQTRIDAIQSIAREKALKELRIKRNGRYISRREALLRYGTFMAAMLEARTAEDVQAAIEFAALPPGSAIIKRRSPFNISINSYLGIYGGRELLLSNEIPTDQEWATTTGLTAPIGISFNFGLHRLSYNTNKKRSPTERYSSHSWLGSLSLFVPFLDLGAVTAFRLKSGNGPALPELTFENVIAPGAYLIYGLPNLPISIGAGAQYGPQLRKVEINSAQLESQALRFSAFLSVDVPIFNIYTRPAY